MSRRQFRTMPNGERLEFEYNGSLTVNVYYRDANVECFTFGEDRGPVSRSRLKGGIDAWAKAIWEDLGHYQAEQVWISQSQARSDLWA